YSNEAVAIEIFGTSYYGYDEEGSQHWTHLLPPGNDTHLVELHDGRLDEDITSNIYTVTLFHQLKCLEIYNRMYLQGPLEEPPLIIHHCLNYLRQHILCQLDTKLESVKTPKAESSRTYTSVCRDWTKIYEAVELASTIDSRTSVSY
ncbi:hypothetical protein AN958_11555, partial [Leucoagaricus sp. SymC.cos]